MLFRSGVDRLVQHSAGSGKSNTIAWTAHALSRLHGAGDAPIFDKVVVITDRKVLDRQLQDTVAGLEHTPGTIVRIDENSAQLKEALEGHAARVIITTLQKFPVVSALAAHEAAEIEEIQKGDRKLHDSFFDLLNQNDPDSAVIDSMASLIASNRKQIELLTFQHFSEIRKVCTEEQKQKFDVIINDALRMMAPRPPR